MVQALSVQWIRLGSVITVSFKLNDRVTSYDIEMSSRHLVLQVNFDMWLAQERSWLKVRPISISRRWGRASHLPGGWPDRGPWSTGGKWTLRRAAPVHAPIPELT